MQRSPVVSPRHVTVGTPSLGERQLLREGDDRLEPRPVLLQPAQVHLGEFDGRDLPRADEFRELRHRPERHLFQVRGPHDTAFACHTEWKHLRGIIPAGQLRIEHDRRHHRVGDGMLPEGLVGLQVPVETPEHHLAFFVGEVQARHLLGVGEDLFGDFSRFLGLRPDHARKESAAQTSGGEVLHEAPAIDAVRVPCPGLIRPRFHTLLGHRSPSAIRLN